MAYTVIDRRVLDLNNPETILDTWSGTIINVPIALAGRITRVVIRKNAVDYPVPATLSVGDSVELHAFGHNDGDPVKTGMRAVITKPDGTTLSGKDEMWTKQATSEELRFSIISFLIDQPGTWTASIEYYAIT